MPNGRHNLEETMLLLVQEIRQVMSNFEKLICVLNEDRKERQQNERSFRCHAELATKRDIERMENNMALKLSELEQTIDGLQARVEKIWGEQQTKYDALLKQFNELKEELDNVEVPVEAEEKITAFEAKLIAFDDTIPDVNA